jgi:hypothetical protein
VHLACTAQLVRQLALRLLRCPQLLLQLLHLLVTLLLQPLQLLLQGFLLGQGSSQLLLVCCQLL